MVRVCRVCSEQFETGHSGPGRPRSRCYACVPDGTRWIGIKAVNDNSPDLRPALAYLKAVAADDSEGIRVLTHHGNLLELVEGLADLLLLFIGDLSDNPAQHVDHMFRAYAIGQGGIQ
jgi:hypothetical protein